MRTPVTAGKQLIELTELPILIKDSILTTNCVQGPRLTKRFMVNSDEKTKDIIKEINL
mgnify:CR=1 FL=1